MVIPKINSAHGSDTRNILNRAIDSINVQGKTIQDLVAEGQLTPGQYATLIQSVNGLISKGDVGINDLSEEVLKKFEGVSPEFNLLSIPRNNSVTPKKTTFMESTKNLFDGEYYRYNLYGSSSAPVVLSENDSENRRTAIINIQPNKTYTIKKHDNTNYLRVASSQSAPAFDEEGHFRDLNYVNFMGNSTEYTFKNNSTDRYLYVYVSDNREEPRLQVEEGEVATSYIPGLLFDFDLLPERIIESLNYSKFTLEQFREIINVNVLWELGSLSVANGSLSGSNYRIRTSEHIYFEKNSYIGVRSDSRFSIRIYEYEKNSSGEYDFISASEIIKSYHLKNDAYIKIIMFVDSDTRMSPYLTEAPEELEAFKSLIEGKTDDEEKTELSYVNGDFDEFYISFPQEDASSSSDFVLVNSVATDIYAKYDALMNQYPNIISRSLRGHATGIDGTPDENYPIYEYHFKSPMNNNNLNSSPEILILTGLHGGEKSVVWSTVKFFEDMFNKWNENQILETIKSNVDFKVIPILNPYGYDQHTRQNARRVDLNRNFGYNFGAGSDTVGKWDYRGEAAYSEQETQIAHDWMQENTDAFAFIDYHNTMHDDIFSYLTSHNRTIEKSYSSLIKRLYHHWLDKYDIDISSQTRDYLATNYYNYPIASNEADKIVGIKNAALLEICQYDQAYENKENTADVIERGIEMLVNHILMILKNSKY